MSKIPPKPPLPQSTAPRVEIFKEGGVNAKPVTPRPPSPRGEGRK